MGITDLRRCELGADKFGGGRNENIAGKKLVATRKATMTPIAATTPSCDMPTNFVGAKARNARAVDGAVKTKAVPIPRDVR